MTACKKCLCRVLLAVSIYLSGISAANIPIPSIRSNRLSNSLNPIGADHYMQTRDWVKISDAPPQLVNQPMGARLELECEAVGSPSPTIQWVKGNTALTENESYESNMINEDLNEGLSKIKSRLIINSVLPIHQGQFTCVATSGSQTAMANTNLLVVPGKSAGPRNFSEYLSTGALSGSHGRVRIVLFNTIVMQPMGDDVIFPCKVVGTPRPDIFWIDGNTEQVIGNQDPRFKVMPDGELRISNIAWSDMGSYTCVARNNYSKDTISTFLYPLLGEN